MKSNELDWYSIDKSFLPEALFGIARLGSLPSAESPFTTHDHGVSIGFNTRNMNNPYNPPALIIVDSEKSADNFSWLTAYAPEAFPLSQFSRVVTYSDWEYFSSITNQHKASTLRTDRWGCIILGEVIAQSDTDTDITAIPLSRSSACFSMPIARSQTIFSDEKATRMCVERLRAIETDTRFVRRSASVEDLIPIWAICTSQINETEDARNIIELVIASIDEHEGLGGKLTLKNHSGLFSDSVEERVSAFNHLTDKLKTSSPLPQRDMNILAAAGAFLVGRGTSHTFLLHRLGKNFSASFVWFGLFAALSGPRSWDPKWSRATKSIEKLLRANFYWDDIPSTDLSWPEYRWLSKTYKGSSSYLELPKNFPRTLSIEVIPGASCQLRLSSQGASQVEIETTRVKETELENDFRSLVNQLMTLAQHGKAILDLQANHIPKQRSLFPNSDTNKKSSKDKRTKSKPK